MAQTCLHHGLSPILAEGERKEYSLKERFFAGEGK
jgi:hypothetical protein